jgi:CHAD domain-containing protein
VTIPSSAVGRGDQQANALVQAALETRWKNYQAQVKLCRREFSRQAVHDLRVAARRLLAVLTILRVLDPHPRIQKMRRFLKNQLDDLDDLRDVQVLLVLVSETIEQLPRLQPFKDSLEKREKRYLRQAHKKIRALKTPELARRVRKTRQALMRQAADEKIGSQLLQAADHAYLMAARLLGQVDAADSATIHRLRLAIKKFRYTVAVVHPLVPDFPEDGLKSMDDYQGAMGDIQDLRVFLDALADFSKRGPASFKPRAVRRFFEQRHAGAIAAFIDDKDKLLTFWRMAPDQPFPWEKNHDPVPHPSRPGGRSRKPRDRRQPAPADQQGPQEDAPGSQGPEGPADPL